MHDIPRALALSFGQLGDRAILAVLFKSLAITLAIFAALAFALNAVIPSLLSGWLDVSGDVYVVLTLFLFIVAAWLLFRIVALAVMQFFADDVVRAVEAKHYPGAHEVAGLPFSAELGNSLRSTGRAVIVNLLAAPVALLLLVTGIGAAAVFWLANALLLGRELQDMVWLRHRGDAEEAQPMSGLTRFALGGVIAAMLAVPFLNLLAPLIGAASATHLVHRKRLIRAKS